MSSARDSVRQPRTVALVSNSDISLARFRGELLRELCHLGYKVVCCAPESEAQAPDNVALLRRWGASYAVTPLQKASRNGFKDLAYVKSLRQVLEDYSVDTVLAYTPKPVAYAPIAASLAGVERTFCVVNGLGYSFSGTGTERWFSRAALTNLLRISFRRTSGIVFYNPDDLAALKNIIPPTTRVHVLSGSGVDTDYFAYRPVEEVANPITFLMASRLLADKGVREYVAAAKILKQASAQARFLLVGPNDANPTAIRPTELAGWMKDQIIEYHPGTEDVRQFLNLCSVFVLPSYREGIPRAILEAMATGRPIITTDTPGCRETVQSRCNGFLVPPKNPQALATAMAEFINNRELVSLMGKESRRMATQRFDVRIVNGELLKFTGLSAPRETPGLP